MLDGSFRWDTIGKYQYEMLKVASKALNNYSKGSANQYVAKC